MGGSKKERFILKENSDCPVCGDGKIKKRKGKFGEFWGCSEYPNCQFAKSIPKEVDPLEKQADDFLRKHGINPRKA